MLLGGAGLGVMRLATAKGSVGMLDATDRLLAGGDTMIRLAQAAQFGPDPAQRVYVYLPTDPALDAGVTGQPLPLVVFIHGGGWVSGDPRDYRFIARALAPLGLGVVLAGYRFEPYPAMLHDGAAALRWVAGNGARLGGDPARIVLMGHSAGAYNAVMLALEARWLADSTLPPQSVRGVVALAGPYDFLPLDDVSTIAAFGRADDLAATQPINHARGDAPPLLLIHGADDKRVRPRHSLALARALARCGARSETHVIDGVGHEGLIMRFARPFSRDRRTLAHVEEFIARVTAHPPCLSTGSADQPINAPCPDA